MSKVAIIIPCFNEASRLSVDSYNQFLSENSNIDIYFINDGSTDNTESEIKTRNCILISLQKNMGKGFAIKKGVLVSKSNWVLICDLDMSVLPDQYLTWNKKKIN